MLRAARRHVRSGRLANKREGEKEDRRTHLARFRVDVDDELAVEDRVRVVELGAVLVREREPVALVDRILAVDLRGGRGRGRVSRRGREEGERESETHEVDLLPEAGGDDEDEDPDAVRLLAHPEAASDEAGSA